MVDLVTCVVMVDLVTCVVMVDLVTCVVVVDLVTQWSSLCCGGRPRDQGDRGISCENLPVLV